MFRRSQNSDFSFTVVFYENFFLFINIWKKPILVSTIWRYMIIFVHGEIPAMLRYFNICVHLNFWYLQFFSGMTSADAQLNFNEGTLGWSIHIRQERKRTFKDKSSQWRTCGWINYGVFHRNINGLKIKLERTSNSQLKELATWRLD